SVELRRCGLVHDSGPPRSASTTGSGKSGAGGLALDEAGAGGAVVCASDTLAPASTVRPTAAMIANRMRFTVHLACYGPKRQRSRSAAAHCQAERALGETRRSSCRLGRGGTG